MGRRRVKVKRYLPGFRFIYISLHEISLQGASLIGQLVKNLPEGDAGSIPGSERSPGEENGNPLQYSYLENPTDRSLADFSLWSHNSRT